MVETCHALSMPWTSFRGVNGDHFGACCRGQCTGLWRGNGRPVRGRPDLTHTDHHECRSGPGSARAMATGRLGMIATPAAGNRAPAEVAWCADNSAINLAWLAANTTLRG